MDKKKVATIVAALLSVVAVVFPELGVDPEAGASTIADASQLVGGIVLAILGAAHIKKKPAE